MTILEAWVFATPFLVLAIGGGFAYVARRELQQARRRSVAPGRSGRGR